MARKASVFWTKSRRARLTREVENYNKRVSRAVKKATEAEKMLLPKSVGVKELRQIISNQKDFERVIKQLQYATAKTLKQTKGTTQYSKKLSRFKRDFVTEAAKAKPPKKISPKDNILAQKAKSIDVTKTMGRFPSNRDFLIKEIGLGAEDEDNYQKILDWVDNPAKRARTMQWKDNYLKTILENYEIAIASNDTKSIKMLKEIYDIVNGLSLAEFVISQLVDQATLAIGQLITSPDKRKGMPFEEERQRGQFERALEIWKTYGTG